MPTKYEAFHRHQPLRFVVVEIIVIEGMASISTAGIKPSASKKLITVLLSFSMQVANGATMLNGHFNDYEESRVKRCTELLLTTPHSALYTSAVAPPWEKEIAKVPLLYDLPSLSYMHLKLFRFQMLKNVMLTQKNVWVITRFLLLRKRCCCRSKS
ncbi:hypothetical protein TNCV_3134431 [Trichonephila clavipes]|nr:hypothetical protein TNCV_3134431 [Trichonephila clavipes]